MERYDICHDKHHLPQAGRRSTIEVVISCYIFLYQIMEELLTTRQVQDLLKVDRITIYRMLQDGRLKGVKIGQQWRFPRTNVERLLSGESTAVASPVSELAAAFPAHCVQPVQDLFAEVSGLCAIILDVDGNPQTEISNACEFCRLLWESKSGKAMCLADWHEFARQAALGKRFFTCHAGLNYWAHPIIENSKTVGWFVTGGFLRTAAESEAFQQRLPRLSQQFNLPLEKLREKFVQIPQISAEMQERVGSWPAIAARAVQGILTERTSFIERLKQIANLTQIT